MQQTGHRACREAWLLSQQDVRHEWTVSWPSEIARFFLFQAWLAAGVDALSRHQANLSVFVYRLCLESQSDHRRSAQKVPNVKTSASRFRIHTSPGGSPEQCARKYIWNLHPAPLSLGLKTPIKPPESSQWSFPRVLPWGLLRSENSTRTNTSTVGDFLRADLPTSHYLNYNLFFATSRWPAIDRHRV